MKKKLIVITLALILSFAVAMPVLAHTAGPCSDSDGDGSASGYEYATHHVAPNAQAGDLGADGHVPGSHQGFSFCDPGGG